MPRALWFVSPGRVELRSSDLPDPGEGECVARGLFSAVSHGTEALLLKGEGPSPFDPSLDEPGTPTYPRRYGYAWVGEVTEGALPKGTKVFALASHAEGHVLSVSQLRPLPTSLPALRGTLAASMETAVNTVWDAEVGLGDRVLVLGGGTIGTLCALLSQRAGGSRVVLREPSDARRQAAREVGVRDVIDAEDPQPNNRNSSERDLFDVVVEATGNPELLDQAIAACRHEGRVVIASFYGTKVASVSLGERFHRQRLTLRSSQVSQVAANRRARFDFERRFEVVLEQLANAKLDALFEKPTPFDQAAQAYSRLLEAPHTLRQLTLAY